MSVDTSRQAVERLINLIHESKAGREVRTQSIATLRALEALLDDRDALTQRIEALEAALDLTRPTDDPLRAAQPGSGREALHPRQSIPEPAEDDALPHIADAILLERLREALGVLPAGEWETWTSNSYRRISARGGPDGGVLHALNQRSDGHPDLSWNERECRAICDIVNSLRSATREKNECVDRPHIVSGSKASQVLAILDDNGLDEAIRFINADPALDRLKRHFQSWSAEQVLYLFEAERPGDMRVRNQVEMLRNDDATPQEREAAREAAQDAASDITENATAGGADADAWAAAYAAGADGVTRAWVAPRAVAQARRLRLMLQAGRTPD